MQEADPWKNPDVQAKFKDLESQLEKLQALMNKLLGGDDGEGSGKGSGRHKEVELDEDCEIKLKRLDRKDVDKPDKFGGNADHWLKWSKSFKKFLRRQDVRWPEILKAIEDRPWNAEERGKPFTLADEKMLEAHADGTLGIGTQMVLFKEQLNEYLENYTTGSSKALVEACGDLKALDAWRQLADKGHSLREQHIHVLRRKAYFPKACSATNEVENHINAWEAEVALFYSAAEEEIPIGTLIMNLVDMCPEVLRRHLKDHAHRIKGNVTDDEDYYALIRVEVSD